MPISYDQDSDTLTVTMGPENYELFELEAGDFTIFIDEAGNLVKITFANASRFIKRALAAAKRIGRKRSNDAGLPLEAISPKSQMTGRSASRFVVPINSLRPFLCSAATSAMKASST